jgi:hypothetical protein
MTQIQIDVPEDLMQKVAIESIEKSFYDKRTTILSILTKYFDKKEKR